jgi:hypothetical protein
VKGAAGAAGPAKVGAADAVEAMPDGTSLLSFVRGVAVRAVSLLAATACLNLSVNPFGSYGTHFFEPIVLTSRRPKLTLFRQQHPAPAIVVLGSSRSFTMEPAYIEARTSRSAFNAAVQGAAPHDYLDLARCFAAVQRFPSTLIVGLGVEQLATPPASIHSDPMPDCSEPTGRSSSASIREYRGLLTLEEASASMRLLAIELRGRPAPLYRFAADGSIRLSVIRPLDRAVDEALTGNWRPSNFDVRTLNPESVDQMRQFLELCRERRANVVVYLPPYQPRATARYLQESRFASLRAQVLEQLAGWAKRYPVKFYDFTEVDSFGGRSDMFYDASHPREDACRMMLDLMLPDLT